MNEKIHCSKLQIYNVSNFKFKTVYFKIHESYQPLRKTFQVKVTPYPIYVCKLVQKIRSNLFM